MKYFLDTEFLEGTQKGFFLKRRAGGYTKFIPTVDLISIGIVAEDGREYYAISKDFNIKEAWNRYDIKSMSGKGGIGENTHDKVYWIRENVLLPIHYELAKRKLDFDYTFTEWKDIITAREHGIYADRHYKTLKKLIKEYGKSNQQIAEEICHFIDARWIEEGNINKGFIYPGGTSIKEVKTTDVQFYGYYSDYDWVAFCWLFGKMIDLPTGFPMYCIDLKQILDEKAKTMSGMIDNVNKRIVGYNNFDHQISYIKSHPNYPKQTNEHNALSDARWNFELYKFLQKI